jgi:hypothetical protein
VRARRNQHAAPQLQGYDGWQQSAGHIRLLHVGHRAGVAADDVPALVNEDNGQQEPTQEKARASRALISHDGLSSIRFCWHSGNRIVEILAFFATLRAQLLERRELFAGFRQIAYLHVEIAQVFAYDRRRNPALACNS